MVLDIMRERTDNKLSKWNISSGMRSVGNCANTNCISSKNIILDNVVITVHLVLMINIACSLLIVKMEL